MTKKLDFSYWAAVLVCFCALLFLLRFFALPLLGAMLPFLLAGVLVLVISPLAGKMAALLRWKKAVCAVLLFFLFLALSVFLGGVALAALVREGKAFLTERIAGSGTPFPLLSGALDALRLPEGGEGLRAQIKTALTDFAGRLAGEVAAKLPGAAANFAAKVPSAVLFLVAAMFAGVYFSAGGERMLERIFHLFPLARQPALRARWGQTKTLLQKAVRAYLVLFLLTFAILFCGFLLLGSQYALLAALAVALVDLLPFFGTGAVLIPWAILELLCQNRFWGFGLLILCLAATVARQIAEPHLIGKTLGVHPLLSLAAGYAGWKFAGVPGLILGPFLLPVLRWGVSLFRKCE